MNFDNIDQIFYCYFILHSVVSNQSIFTCPACDLSVEPFNFLPVYACLYSAGYTATQELLVNSTISVIYMDN